MIQITKFYSSTMTPTFWGNTFSLQFITPTKHPSKLSLFHICPGSSLLLRF